MSSITYQAYRPFMPGRKGWHFIVRPFANFLLGGTDDFCNGIVIMLMDVDEFISPFIIGNCMKLVIQCFLDRKSTRLNSSHVSISYAVFCLKKQKTVKTYNK